MKKVLIIADSLAMPGLGNAYEDTWVYKLKSAFSEYDYNTIFSRGARTDVLVTSGGMIKNYDDLPAGSDCLEYYTPHIVILQLGIVDGYQPGRVSQQLVFESLVPILKDLENLDN